MNERANILVVDDNALNLNLVVDVLSAEGYEIRATRKGEEALRSVRSHQPDLVLLDVSIPGLDGYQVCRELKADELTRSVPVVFMTGLDGQDIQDRCRQAGGLDCIVKPFDIYDFLSRVRDYIDSSEARRRPCAC